MARGIGQGIAIQYAEEGFERFGQNAAQRAISAQCAGRAVGEAHALFQRAHHFAHGDLIGRMGQRDAAAAPAVRNRKPRLHQRLRHLGDMVIAEPLLRGERGQRDRAALAGKGTK